VLKICEKKKKKKCPTNQNKKVKKMNGANLVESAPAQFQSQKVTIRISNKLWLKPKQGFPFLFLKQEGSCRVKPVGLGFTLHKNYTSFLNKKGFSHDITHWVLL
jgi:hypothetical protein